MSNTKKLITDTLLVILGNLLLAFGVTAFLVPSGMITGGATGVALLLEQFLPLHLSDFLTSITII